MAKGKELDPDIKRLTEKAIERVVQHMEDDVFEIEGTPMLTIKLSDDTYRKKPAIGGMELVFKSAYIGKSGKVIFCFDPVDEEQNYKGIEFNGTELDRDLPMFGPQMADAFAVENSVEAVNNVMAVIMNKIQWEEQAAALEAEKALEVAYVDNPLFGRF